MLHTKPTTTTFLAASLLLITQTLTEGVTFWKRKAIYQVITDRFYNSSEPNCPNWKGTYCGGNWNGLIDKMDYIHGMGFTAIWVSPVQENAPNAYHGYSIVNIFKLNPHFGDETIFRNLSDVGHQHNVSIMVDVVPNHMASVMFNFSKLTPFNRAEYFHDYCYIQGDDYAHNMWRIVNCRLLDLPDLKHEHPFVRNTLTKWVADFVHNYSIEGLRLDAVPHQPHWFLKSFSDAVNTNKTGTKNGTETYIIGECFDPRIDFVASYQKDIDGLLNFPMMFKAVDVFALGKTADEIRDLWAAQFKSFDDVYALGLFLDNQDRRRFLYFIRQDMDQYYRLGNALSFIFFAPGIPIVYYGTEHEYNMADDPLNRFPLWEWRGPTMNVSGNAPTGGDPNYKPYSTQATYYLYIKTLNHFRDLLEIYKDENNGVRHLTVTDSPDNHANDVNLYTFQRGQAVIASPTGSFDYAGNHTLTLGGLANFKANQQLCDIHNITYCVNVDKTDATKLTFEINLGRARVFVDASLVKGWDPTKTTNMAEEKPLKKPFQMSESQEKALDEGKAGEGDDYSLF